eukprot:TRINITY_DN22386_c0_g2_i1.p1 TRINITY_DN22386_c0_g2~~TRINITY_DN22386_c0_g2_i1.p1  ORF type:complete len:612 (-),score=39.18 TRINITY_DN22386_c0_g2_i1:584-2419(-)
MFHLVLAALLLASAAIPTFANEGFECTIGSCGEDTEEMLVSMLQKQHGGTARDRRKRTTGHDPEEIAWAALPQKEQACFQEGYEYKPHIEGPQGKKTSYADSPDSCQAQCASISGCRHFSYFADKYKCFFSDADAKSKKKHRAISGPPRCANYRARVVAVNDQAPSFPAPHNDIKRALCFSGGGSRALSAEMGYLRALHYLSILPNVDAMSTVSGGTWASSQYMFASMATPELLGNATAPSELHMVFLRTNEPAMGHTATTSTNELWKNEQIKWTAACEYLTKSPDPTYPDVKTCLDEKYSEMWITVISQAFLQPHGLDGKRMMAGSEEGMEAAQALNEYDPSLDPSKWIYPVADRPKVYIMGGTLLAPVGYRSGGEQAVVLQMSPDYTGSPYSADGGNSLSSGNITYHSAIEPRNASNESISLLAGGGFVETFAFGTRTPMSGQNGGTGVFAELPAKPFSLEDAVGISSSAFAAAFAEADSTQAINPQGSYWPVTSSANETQTETEYQLETAATWRTADCWRCCSAVSLRQLCSTPLPSVTSKSSQIIALETLETPTYLAPSRSIFLVSLVIALVQTPLRTITDQYRSLRKKTTRSCCAASKNFIILDVR